MRADRAFVVVSGLPGSGKTTLARAIAPLLELPVIDKDEILEGLFEFRGIVDGAWRRQLSRESDAILQASAAASAGAVISSFWHVPGMAPDSGTPTEWLTALTGTIVNVHCECPPHVAAERFRRRVRHAGHRDDARTSAEIIAGIEALVPFATIAVGERVIVNTTGPVALALVVRDVEEAFIRCGAQR